MEELKYVIGEIQKICGEKGFEIEFTIGGKI